MSVLAIEEINWRLFECYWKLKDLTWLLLRLMLCRGKVSRVPWYFIHWLFGTSAVLLAWYNIFKGLDLYVTSWTVGTQKVGTYHPNYENPNLCENIILTVHNLRNLAEKFCTLTFICQASNVRTVCQWEIWIGFLSFKECLQNGMEILKRYSIADVVS